MPDANGGCLGRLKGWLWLGGLAAAVVLAASIDSGLKTAPHLGFIPPETRWMVLCRDTGVLGEKLEATPAFARYLSGHPSAVADLRLRLRRATHIDLDHRRWARWFGPAFIAAGDGAGWGVCVRPGLALRSLDALRRLFTKETVLRFGGHYYAWRDGFLVISRSPDYVRAVLRAGSPVDFRRGGAADEAVFISTADPRCRIVLRAAAGLPISGTASLAAAERDAPLTLANGFIGNAAITCAASDWDSLEAIFEPFRRPVLEAAPPELLRVAQGVRDSWRLGELPPDWDAGVAECAVAFEGLDVVEGLPIPRLAAVFRMPYAVRGAHPWAPLTAPAEPAPYAWGDTEGSLAPLWGPEFGLALAGSGRDWYAYSAEALARTHGGQRPAEGASTADAVVLADWARVAEEAREMLDHLAENGLLPGRNPGDVSQGLGQILLGAAELGTCHIEAAREGRQLRLSGWLEREAEDGPGAN